MCNWKLAVMNWLFNLSFLIATRSAVLGDDDLAPGSLPFPKLEDIDSVFRSSFEKASYGELFDTGAIRVLKGDEDEKPQDILSYRQHGYHPGNEATWKLKCVWNAMNNVARHLPQVISSSDNETRALTSKMCSEHAWESCGVDFEETKCDEEQEFRTIDGTCNNLEHTRWGAADQPFERFVSSEYGDGVSTFRVSTKGENLPNPRRISRALSGSKRGPQPQVSLMLMQWGQFLDHDIALTPERELGEEKWSPIKEACIRYNNWRIFNGVPTINDCIKKCFENSTLCRSIDYHPEKQICHLSRSTSESQYYTEPCYLEGWLFVERKSIEEVEGSRTIECCNEGIRSNSDPTLLGSDCVPIDVSEDPFYVRSPNRRDCIRFIRSAPAPQGCQPAPMEQMNINTAFVDGSMVYGSDTETAAFVRDFSHGLLKTTAHAGNGQALPPRGGEAANFTCPQRESMDNCYIAGDVRVDEIPGLTALHTTFIRLHNVIAKDLCKLNPGLCENDERLYQEARRIVVALIQQITYRDWLPHVVGSALMEENQLDVESQGYRDMYDPSVNPTIRNVFATAAFRFGHSLIAGKVKAEKQVNDLKVPGHFFNIDVIQGNATSPSSLLKGLTRCPSAPIDAIVEPAFTDSLFAEEPEEDGNFYGLDLVSLNIQRGRDHGIPGYTAWRRFCGLKDPATFKNLKNIMNNDLVKELKRIYHNVDDIDLFPAGLAEDSIADGILGPTFSCIIARQFALLKRGDRFWYERKDQPRPFTPDQLSAIRSQGLVSILCRVTEHTSLGFQPDPFLVETPSHQGNAVMDCSSYNFINLEPWRNFHG